MRCGSEFHFITIIIILSSKFYCTNQIDGINNYNDNSNYYYNNIKFPYIDRSVEPCDDFYKYACGNFENYYYRYEYKNNDNNNNNENDNNDDYDDNDNDNDNNNDNYLYDNWDSFIKLQKQVDERLKGLLENDVYDNNNNNNNNNNNDSNFSSSDARYLKKSRDMYAGCMDEMNRNKNGIEPIKKIIKEWPSKYYNLYENNNKNLTHYNNNNNDDNNNNNNNNNEEKKISNLWINMGKLIANYGIQFIFKFNVKTDLSNVTRHAIHIDRDELILPSSLLKKKKLSIIDEVNLSKLNDATFVNYLFNIMTKLRDFNNINNDNNNSSTNNDNNYYHDYYNDDDELLKRAKNVNRFMIMIRDLTDSEEYDKENFTDNNNNSNNDNNNRNNDNNNDSDDNNNRIPNFGSTTLNNLQLWTEEILYNFTDTIKWKSYLKKVFKKSRVIINDDTRIFIKNRKILRNLLILSHIVEENLMNDFIYSRLATFMIPELSSDFYKLSIDFYTKRGYVPVNYPKWKYCLHKVLDYPKIGTSFALAKKYTELYVNDETISRAKYMIENVRDSLKELIDEAEWMDEWTKGYALYKLKNILIFFGGPDYLFNITDIERYYKKLKIFRNDHFGNTNRLRSFNQAKNFEELMNTRRRNLWTESPLIVNAYYNGLNNRILFPISTMSAPFFTDRKTSLLDYAGIGSIMAHELTHAFDSQGKLLDAEGSLVGWWSQSTADIYDNKIKCFIKQYNKYYSKGSDSESTVDGAYNTLAENVADNVGLRAAYRAFVKERYKRIYSISNRYRSFNDIQYFNDKEFYLAFATIWCKFGKRSKDDTHSPHRYRVNGPLKNMKNFYKAWQCRNDNQSSNINSSYYKNNRIRMNNNNNSNNRSTIFDNDDLCILW